MIKINTVIDQTAFLDFMRELAGVVKTALVSAIGRDVKVVVGLDAGVPSLSVKSGVTPNQVRTIAMVNGVIPVMRSGQSKNNSYAKTVDEMIVKAIVKTWPRFAKKVIRVVASNN